MGHATQTRGSSGKTARRNNKEKNKWTATTTSIPQGDETQKEMKLKRFEVEEDDAEVTKIISLYEVYKNLEE